MVKTFVGGPQGRRPRVVKTSSPGPFGHRLTPACARGVAPRDVIPATQFGGANRHRTSPPAGTMCTMPNSTPVTAWKALKEGNERFVAGKPQHPSQGIERRASLAAAQTPNAVVFGCADSRVAAEIIFDQGLGDMTVVRTAGHVIGSAVLGSIEYAVTVLNVPLIVVLGHDSCGAVKATLSALDDGVVPGGYVRDVVERVTPSILLGRRDGLTRVDEFEARHVSETAAQLRSRSTAVAERLDAGTLAIAGVTYQLADGRVTLRDYLGDIGEGSRSSPASLKCSPTVRKAAGPTS